MTNSQLNELKNINVELAVGSKPRAELAVALSKVIEQIEKDEAEMAAEIAGDLAEGASDDFFDR